MMLESEGWHPDVGDGTVGSLVVHIIGLSSDENNDFS